MPSLLDSYPKLSTTDNDIRITDALVAAKDVEANILVTSPNAAYIPRLPQGRVSLYMVADGTYGAFDPACWPQVYHPDFAYFAAVSKAIAFPHPHSAIWNKPTLADFKVLEGVPARNFGLLTDDFVWPLESLTAELEAHVKAHVKAHKALQPSIPQTRLLHHQSVVNQTCQRLRHIPATLRDHQVQVSLLCRHWLLAMAYMRFAELEVVPETSVAHDLMGAWTSDVEVVQDLHTRGLPVWFVRNCVMVPSHTRIGREVPFTAPPSSYAARMCYTPVYEGPVGYDSLLATQRTVQTYYDVSRNPSACLRTIDSALNTHDPSSTIKASPQLPASELITIAPVKECLSKKRPQSMHPSHIRHGRNKFTDPAHPWMPPSIPSWQRALSEVNRSAPAKPPGEVWPYWIPEPALLISSHDPSKQRRYLMNWVRARPIWISLLQLHDRPASIVNTQGWRTYLNGLPTDASTQTVKGRRALYIKEIFSDVLAQDEIEPSNTGDVDWHGHSFSEVPAALCPLILWEVHELAFRYELLALDRAFRGKIGMIEESQVHDRIARVFSAHGLWSVTRIPDVDEPGLFAAVPHRRITALNALRDVVVRWPECPKPLQDVADLTTRDDPATVEAYEYWLATFYVRTFFARAGRPPILPHFLPSPSSLS